MPLKTHQDDVPAINLTPMIDIVFNLIIFFMVSTRFTEIEQKVDVSVPQVSDVSTLSEVPKSRAINVYRDGAVTLDGQNVTMSELANRLAADYRQRQDLGIVVRGDADASFQNVAAVITTCKQAGISEMGISVRLAAGPSGTKER
jgi:biopolymer transport protein ExbD